MLIDTFNDTIDIWISELNRFDLAQLLLKPDDGSWSLGQLYNHLIEDTGWFNDQIEISLTDEANRNVQMSEAARTLFAKGSFSDERIQGDPLSAEKVKQPKSIKELRTGLEQLKFNTNVIWSKMQSMQQFGKSEHPGLGFFNCYEWLQYSEMHMRHHLRQKERIERFLNTGKTV
ncbi:DinB family protein [Flavihumibacter sp.]|uniref:DinB family protein n=1 Tax=Flavihumibacter sp. TaxID=1913981 RepID=UPI002FCBB470